MDACMTMIPSFNIKDPNWVSDKRAFGIVNQTVGHLLKYDNEWCITASELDENGHPRDVTDIPSSLVLEIEELVHID
jgi:hypothetical protein